MANPWFSSWNIFGFKLSTPKEDEIKNKELENQKSFTVPANEDGSIVVQSGSYHGVSLDMDGQFRNEIELITKYRDMSLQPEIESGIDDIINEAIVIDDKEHSVKLNLDECKLSAGVKKKIADEFENILKMLNFNRTGHEIFRKWYVDGRIYYEIIIGEGKEKEGIKELRSVDPRRMRKVREIVRTKDNKTGTDLIQAQDEYFLYNERGIIGAATNIGVKITTDKVVYVPSGLMDSKKNMVIGYLQKCIKPLNQLRMLEDAAVIYRMARAPERRVFKIDVGNMSPSKSEEYIKSIMTNHRNKIVYDSIDGSIKDDRKFTTMLEDFWFPIRSEGRGSDVTTLPGGNIDNITDVEYFEKKLYKALGVPYSRNSQGTGGFNLGRPTEITRDELKFSKFIDKIRNKFSCLFDDIMRVQLSLKGIATPDEWMEIREKIWYDFLKDNNFNELKESELTGMRLALLMQADPFAGKYFSKDWVRKNVMNFDDEEIKEQDKLIEDEVNQIVDNPPKIDPTTGLPFSMSQPGGPLAPPQEQDSGQEPDKPEYSDDQIQTGINSLNNSVQNLR